MSNPKKYGITPEQYEELKARFNQGCWICGALPKKKSHAIDHNHKTMKVRGILCNWCNFRLIGRNGDRVNGIELMKKAVWYLENARDNPIDGIVPPRKPRKRRRRRR